MHTSSYVPAPRPAQSLRVGRYGTQVSTSVELTPNEFRFSARYEDPGLLAAIESVLSQITASADAAEDVARRLQAVHFPPSSVQGLLATDEGRGRLNMLVELLQKCVRYLQQRHTRLLGTSQSLESVIGAADQAIESLRGDRDRLAEAYEGARATHTTPFMPDPSPSLQQSLDAYHARLDACESEGQADTPLSSTDLHASHQGVLLDVAGLGARAQADDVVSNQALDLLKQLRSVLVNGVVSRTTLIKP